MRSYGIENGQKTTNNEYRLSLHRFSSKIKFKFKIISRLYGLFLQSIFFDLSCKDGVNVRNRLNRIVGFLTLINIKEGNVIWVKNLKKQYIVIFLHYF